MKRISIWLLLAAILSLLCIFAICNKSHQRKVNFSPKTNSPVKEELYNCRSLNIGIIGNIPKVREKQIKFTSMQFSDLEKQTADSKYDAIIITKDNLSQAGQGKYLSIYKITKIPFFFIESEKSYVPFIEKDLTYENAPDINNRAYATGIMFNANNNPIFWDYNLYNDIKNQTNIMDVYSRIFKTIADNTPSKP